MILWRDVSPNHAAANVRVRGFAIARLHAKPNSWQVELMDGSITGPASSLGHAKRAALKALSGLLPDVELAVQAALVRT